MIGCQHVLTTKIGGVGSVCRTCNTFIPFSLCGCEACKSDSKTIQKHEYNDYGFYQESKEKLTVDGQELKSGEKKDDGKPMLELIPFEVLEAVGRILTKGAKTKYAPRNWELGIAFGRVFGAALRHMFSWWTSKLFGRDGINHADGNESELDHAITELMFLSAYEKRGMKEFDDRPGK